MRQRDELASGSVLHRKYDSRDASSSSQMRYAAPG